MIKGRRMDSNLAAINEGIRRLDNVMLEVEATERSLNERTANYTCAFNKWVDVLCESLKLAATVGVEVVDKAYPISDRKRISSIAVPEEQKKIMITNVTEAIKAPPLERVLKGPSASIASTSAGGSVRQQTIVSGNLSLQSSTNIRASAPPPSTGHNTSGPRQCPVPKPGPSRGSPVRVSQPRTTATTAPSSSGLATRTHRHNQVSRGRGGASSSRTQVTRRLTASNVTDEWESETLARVQVHQVTPTLRLYNPGQGHFIPDNDEPTQ